MVELTKELGERFSSSTNALSSTCRVLAIALISTLLASQIKSATISDPQVVGITHSNFIIKTAIISIFGYFILEATQYVLSISRNYSWWIYLYDKNYPEDDKATIKNSLVSDLKKTQLICLILMIIKVISLFVAIICTSVVIFN